MVSKTIIYFWICTIEFIFSLAKPTATFTRVSIVIKNYSEATSFPGLTQIYRKEQTALGATFWIVTSFALLITGIFWYKLFLIFKILCRNSLN